MKIKSIFSDGEKIPVKYTADEEDINPSLEISGIPEGAKTLALIVDDPDAPIGTWVHWLVWNIPASKTKIEENSVPGIQGINDFRKRDYGGPNPPSGTHRYFFKLYALDSELNLPEGSKKAELEKAMQGHILATAQLIGKYSR